MTGFFREPYFFAAERFEVHFEEMSIPISIQELNGWTKDQSKNNSELATWLSLLGFESREGLANFLQDSFSKDKDMALQLLQSWYGRKMFEEIVDLVRLDNEPSGEKMFSELVEFLKSSKEETVLEFLRKLPAEVIHIDLDGMVKAANLLRRELKLQQKLVSDLSLISIPKDTYSEEIRISSKSNKSISKELLLKVPHRKETLPIEIWQPFDESSQRSSLIVLMPGLGGDKEHFRWLADSLSINGWSVVVLQHPGSDSIAVKALLEGELPAPGLEVIPDRLLDLQAVLDNIENETIKVSSNNIVLMGHSLGAFTAFLASGTSINPGLNQSCSNAINDFFLTNLSELLQCQLVDVSFVEQRGIPKLSAIVGINSFGSLVWPNNSSQKLSVPVFLTGGTFDLITPPVSEQLGLFFSTKPNLSSRVLLVEGASHFSPIRVSGQFNNERGKDVFKLDKSLVGLDPVSVQSLLANEIIKFLNNIEGGKNIPLYLNKVRSDIRFYILDRPSINSLIIN